MENKCSVYEATMKKNRKSNKRYEVSAHTCRDTLLLKQNLSLAPQGLILVDTRMLFVKFCDDADGDVVDNRRIYLNMFKIQL